MMHRDSNSNESPLCLCGCGEKLKRNRSGNFPRFIRGHNSKLDCSPSNNGHSTRFKIGNQQGKGRPKGSRNRVSLAAENIFENEAGTIARRAVDMALSGDRAMIKLVIERCVPVKKSVPVRLPDLPAINSVADGPKLTAFVLDAIASGKISPVVGETISRSCERHLKALQVGDLEARLEELEQQLTAGQ